VLFFCARLCSIGNGRRNTEGGQGKQFETSLRFMPRKSIGGGGEHGPQHCYSTRGWRRADLREDDSDGIPESGMPCGFRYLRRNVDRIGGFWSAVLRAPGRREPSNSKATSEAGRADSFSGTGETASLANAVKRPGRHTWVRISPIVGGVNERLVQIEQAVRQSGFTEHAGGIVRSPCRLRDGRTIPGPFAKNESNYDLQIQSIDGSVFTFLTRGPADTKRSASRKSLMPPVEGDGHRAG